MGFSHLAVFTFSVVFAFSGATHAVRSWLRNGFGSVIPFLLKGDGGADGGVSRGVKIEKISPKICLHKNNSYIVQVVGLEEIVPQPPGPVVAGWWGSRGVGGGVGCYKTQDIFFYVVLHILYRNISTIELL